MTTTFTYSPKFELIAADGPQVTKALANLPAGGKVLVDDQFNNNDVIDLGALCANITVPTYVAVKCGNQGVKINPDGLGYSTKLFSSMLLEIVPQTGALALLLKANGPAQRIQVLVVGEP